MLLKLIPIVAVASALAACGRQLPADIAEASMTLPEKVDYNFHIRPILSDRCYACHGPDKNKIKAGLRFDLEEIAKAELSENPGNYAIVEGNPGNSRVLHRIISDDPEFMMPPPESNLALSSREKAMLIKWIEQGAEYKPHWAFIKPERRETPRVQNSEWPGNEIDYFILNKIEAEGLITSPQASKETLIRRVTFDLTGLPPTLEEIDDFLADTSPNAYEKVVDRLLGEDAYGERMAVNWLDLARYADSHGYQDDGMRNMWPYRDWVIEKFNQNLPFDTFIKWQLAGDLLPNPTQEQILATAFNRNHTQSQEGGIVPEEYRIEYVADRTQTFGRAFLGLTIECARCHDHKYDPISQKEYYQIFGFFNNVNESGKIPYVGEASPTVILTDEETDKKVAFIRAQISQEEELLAGNNFQPEFAQWLADLESGKGHQIELKGQIGYFAMDEIKKVKGKDGDKYQIENLANPAKPASVMGAPEDQPEPVEGVQGKALEWPGRESSWVESDEGFAKFERNEPFSISFYVKVLDNVKEGPLIGRCAGTHNGDRGYELFLEQDLTLTANLVHVFPDNQIKVASLEPLLRNQWYHLALTYDGSSRAEGVKIYRDGEVMNTEIKVDNLLRSIIGYGKDKINWGYGDSKFRIGFKLEYAMRGIVVDELRIFNKKLTALEVEKIYGKDDPIGDILNSGSNNRTAERLAQLTDYYLTNISSQYRGSFTKLTAIRGEENDILSGLPEVMVMKDLPEPRSTFILTRGQYDAPALEVTPGTPESIGAFPSDLPVNRLGLAEWLLDSNNPVMARVTANRFWQQVFGKGIVNSSDDFGNQGALPTHPELLDWMAIRLIESGWDTKQFLKLLVTSSTYRQSSFFSPELLEKDPDNQLYAKGSSYRLSAEMIRDNALAASGLLARKIGGPSVHPYQPKGLWKELATRNETVYVQNHGDSLYRRSLYTIWKRTSPPPSMMNFDATTRDFCTIKRQKTSTPLQSLVLMNDPQFVEAARVMAENLVRQQDLSDEERIIMAFRLLTSRHPSPSELNLLAELLQKELDHFEADLNGARSMLTVGEYPVDQNLDPAQVAAHMVLTSTLLNYDEAVIKR